MSRPAVVAAFIAGAALVAVAMVVMSPAERAPPSLEEKLMMLKSYKAQLSILSGPKYDFNLSGAARRPGVKLNQHVFDFGQCFVTSQPVPNKKTLTITNIDN